ncbi:voltage-dependent T-type calcium channel subunit alpha-1H, partial [Oncorhynchus nerka]|uniref:voltage-dependent T-type calcium channel subunit alpha-1H n=1 Tax=Oncorhynchus nerka TaxID=8023 RepID=UPI0031B8A712
VGNLGLLFMLLFFIYAALGVELFGKLECSEENPCEGLSRHATFQNFGMAFLTLFRVSTGDNWNGIMKVVEEERCRGSLLTAGRPSLSRMMSLPSDSYMLRPLQPLRHTRYPPIGHDTYKGCGFSGSVYSMGSSGAGSLLQVPGALPSGSHASLSSRGSSCRPTVRLSPSHSVDRHSLSMARHTPRRPGHVDSRRASYIHSPSHSMDTHSYRLSTAQSIDRDSSRYLDRRASYIHSPSHSMDSRHTPYIHSPSHSMDSRHTPYLHSPSHSMDSRHTPYFHSPSHSMDRRHTPHMDRHTPYIHSPSHSMDSRHTLYIHSPSHSMDSRHTPYVSSPAHSSNRHTPHNNRHTSHMSSPSHSMDRQPEPRSSLSVRRQLRRQ